MKKDIHPTLYPAVYVDVSSGEEFITTTTVKSRETKEIDGVVHQLVVCDVTASTHPVFTGKKTTIDSTGRIEKFNMRFKRRR